MKKEAVVIIPARFASVRLPGKPLIRLSGKPMIQHVYERALQIPGINRVMVATDDDRIYQCVRSLGGEVFLTPEDISNGSERVGYLAKKIDTDIIVNLQGDEPLISPKAVGEAVSSLKNDSQMNIATLGVKLKTKEDWLNPSVVKVITDHQKNAIYFSRAPIPFHREKAFTPVDGLYRHIGVYVYRKSFLLSFLEWPEGLWESIEKLEQLRILERGYSIKVVETDDFSPGVDTPEDVAIVESLIKQYERDS